MLTTRHLLLPIGETVSRTALIVLNSPLRLPNPLFDKVKTSCRLCIAADGGANRLYKGSYTPDLIVGDLDSIEQSVRDHYSSKGVTIIQDPCQDSNDLDKALQQAVQHSDIDNIIIWGAFGGRFDQEMASIQALFKWNHLHFRLVLLNEHNCAVLLNTGHHTIELQHHMGRTCGLIPMGGPCESVTTTGFEWDLNQQSMEFGGLVSTSNRLTGTHATVETSHALLLTIQVPNDNPDWN
jgi:thiamine pyrophosphokinase